MDDKIVRMRDVPALVGLSRTAVLNAIEEGTFPEPILLTDSAQKPAKGFLYSEIQKWIRNRAAKRDGGK